MSKRTKPESKQGPTDFIRSVGELLESIGQSSQPPTLVGGMALVILGSTRVTRDFDFLIAEEERDQKTLVEAFYEHGFELASKLDRQWNVVRTIDDETVAFTRLRIDRPKSAYFYNHASGLKVDLLFDFPLPANEVHQRSTHKKIQSFSFHVASKKDLIEMKEIAIADRSLSSDLQDLEFLRSM